MVLEFKLENRTLDSQKVASNDKFTIYANRFRGGDMRKNRLILLNNIIEGIKIGNIQSGSKDLTKMKEEIANLIIKLFTQ